ncbi:hypothetical protein [Clostridium weizhouense]|uniref:Uncharacterized protein n=1 Tax=Clostridium weizhouense TaxID=2859781 RepID=A0ABS7AQR2_9CLOT|nr:hypothetical protein [Clostridium weizhouense]MBW6411006.1 hypothetical protein [Clostridium weizhouense]
MLIEEVFYKVEVEKLLINMNATLKNLINLITLTRDYDIFYNEIKDVNLIKVGENICFYTI